MPRTRATIPAEHRADVERLWNYHNMHHEIRPVDVGIGLGSHDLGVAKAATDLYHRGMFPTLVFTGANAATTIETFPRGEAVHYREYAIAHRVPADAILIDTQATNTGQNIEYTRALLAEHRVQAQSVILMSRPYQQRRAYATCKKFWPDVKVICASHPLTLDDYVTSIGNAKKVIDMLVGDTQRIDWYAELGFAIPQHVPDEVRAAYSRLIDAGYTSRLV
ncbi:YdcF family protein [Micromonospora sp. PSH03]|uniref:YdcF family protein n=1 Tax=Micromonospora salmantinae TaxID=2911211 RepID=UPI001EE7A583|nr:YdcF family protein [Micromonospora salmantinae]MCG5456778.1 YdcF family protein [Micromonospora salmantinae]